MPHSTRTISGEMAEFVVDLEPEDFPRSTWTAAKALTLDALGVAVAGGEAAGVGALRDLYRRWGGSPEAGVLVYGDRLPPPHAAAVNATMIHALDLDDVYLPASLHLSSCILPAALACADAAGCSGRQLLASLIAGVEVATRLGVACEGRWDGAFRKGFLQTTVIGGFGATVAAARLLGLGADQTVNALGLYHARNAGNRQALYDKTLAKRLQPGFAAHDAVESAFMAAAGLTGPHQAIEGEAGLQRLYMNTTTHMPENWLSRDPERWQIELVSIKRFASCGACHPLTHAALQLSRRERLEPGDIEHVRIYLGEGGSSMVGLPFSVGPNPQVDAQFSAAYGVALGLLRNRAGLAEYTDRQVRADTAVAELAARTEVVTHLDEPPPRRPAGDGMPAFVDLPHLLMVRTCDGAELTQTATIRDVLPPGGTSLHEVEGKFRDCVAFSGCCSVDRAGQLLQRVLSLEAEERVRDLISEITFTPGGSV